MPNIIKDRAIVADDYHVIAEVGSFPSADILVSLEIWQQQREQVLAHPYKKGVVLKPDQHPELIADDIGCFDLIAIAFPAFAEVVVILTCYCARTQQQSKQEPVITNAEK